MKNRIRDYVEAIAKKSGRPISVSLLGLGVTNRAVLKTLERSPYVRSITVRQNGIIRDTLPAEVKAVTGDCALSDPDEDLIFTSPSVRREKIRFHQNSTVTSDTEIFFDEHKSNVFLVSGSDGKSTVTTLISLLIFPTFPNHFTGGNLGLPLAEAQLDSDAFVLELSSFNLRYLLPKCKRAVLTNVSPNHLDWHDSLREYRECKLRLISSAEESVLNLDCTFLETVARVGRSFALVSFRQSHTEIVKNYATEHTVTNEAEHVCIDGEPILPLTDIGRKEKHNIINLMLAIGMTLGYTSAERICEVAKTFTGLAHRCEIFSEDGVDYVNSSIDTSPDRTKTTLESLGRRVNLILGGRSKRLSYSPLREPILKYVNKISVYGTVCEEIFSWLDSDEELAKIPKARFDVLADAIDHAALNVPSGGAVLLSPAATSYGEFRDYAERGAYFKKYITEKHAKI